MKKMKKIFSKLFVLTMILAVLAPYVNIPIVEAETDSKTCDGEWEYHDNYYFLLAADTPSTWVANFAANDLSEYNESFKTNVFTDFVYTFPYDSSLIEFDEKRSGVVELDVKDDGYDEDFDYNSLDDDDKYPIGQFYYDYLREGNGTGANYGAYSYAIEGDESRITTLHYHGAWADAGKQEPDEEIRINSSDRLEFKEGTVALSVKSSKLDDHIEKMINASVVIDDDAFKIAIGGQTKNIDYDIETIFSNIEEFNNKKGDAAYIDAISNKKSEPTIEFIITREYTLENLLSDSVKSRLNVRSASDTFLATSDEMFSSENIKLYAGIYLYNKAKTGIGDGVLLHFPGNCAQTTDPTGATLELVPGCWDFNYQVFGNNPIMYSDGKMLEEGQTLEKKTASIQTSYRLKTSEDNAYYDWFFAPNLFRISYKVCKNGGTSTNEVALSYDSNVPANVSAEVANMPEKLVQAKGSEFTISDKIPTLTGYKFKEWNLSPTCDSTGYEPGFGLGALENDTTLFACWGTTGKGEVKPTGVLTYTGLFAGIISLAGGGYYLIKKKNLFKKI